MRDQIVHTGDIGFLGVLCLIFITLKLTGYITWSWWAVLAPLWVPAFVVLGTMMILGLIILIVKMIDDRKNS